MKKISILILFLISANLYAQFDLPIDTTTHYGLRKYAQSAKVPAEILNEDKDIIDSVMYSLITFTDTLQLIMEMDTSISHDTTLYVLKHSPYSSGHNSFNGTAQYDTVTVTSMDSLDVVTVTIRESVPTANDILSVKVLSGKFIVQRPASGTSGLKYNWIWRRVYN